METKVYKGQKKHVLKDGTIKYYETRSTYTPKNKPGERRTRQKKEGSAASVFYELKELGPHEIEEVRRTIRDIKSKRGGGEQQPNSDQKANPV